MSAATPSTPNPADPHYPRLSGLSRPETLRANDATIAALQAGYEQLTAFAKPSPPSTLKPLRGLLSRKAIADAARTPDGLRVSETMLRDRWDPHENYVSDLMDWVAYLHHSTWISQNAAIVARLESEADTIGTFIDEVAFSFQERFFAELPMFRVELLCYSLMHEASIDDRLGHIYRDTTERWLPIFEQAIDRFGGTLRPGVDLSTLIEICTAVGDGLAVRELAEPTSGERRIERTRLLATATRAILAAATTGLEDVSPYQAPTAAGNVASSGGA